MKNRIKVGITKKGISIGITKGKGTTVGIFKFIPFKKKSK